MPYIISPIIRESFKGMWGEGSPYKKNTIYQKDESSRESPPVNYSSYTLKPHSLPHIETSAHISNGAPTIEYYFSQERISHFYGRTVVLRLEGDHFKTLETNSPIRIWSITKDQVLNSLQRVTKRKSIPKRLIITLKDIPLNNHELHDPNYVLILEQEAAAYLVENGIELYGTSWKSSDYNPGGGERPIHNTLFQSALIMECLDLNNVPEGIYFLSAFPIPLEGASESPVCPVLYTYDEIGED